MINTPQALQNIIYVGDISISLNENDIRQYFSQFGFILSSRFDFNAFGNRYGFLRYADAKSVEAAIKNANHVSLFGSKPIRVTRWRDPKSFGKENNVFVMNIPPNCDTKQFDEAFSKYGPIFSSKLTATGYGYVEYTSKESAAKCLEEGKVQIMGIDVAVSEYQSKSNRGSLNNNLYVKNLPQLNREELEEKLKEIFGRFGEIRSMLVIETKSDRNPFAFICYSKVESAENALKSLHHTNPFEENSQENLLDIIFANSRKEVESLNQTNIVIKNIKPTVDQQQLFTIFSQFGEIVRIMKTSREGVPTHVAFIRYKKPEQATQAIIKSTKDESIKSIFDGRIYITYLQDKKTRMQYKEMLNRSAKLGQVRPKVEAPFMPIMPQYNNPQLGLMPPVVNMPFPAMNMGNPQMNMMGGNFQNMNPQNQFGIAGNQMGMYSDQSQMMYSQGNQQMMPPVQNYQFQRQGQGNMQYNNQRRGGYQGNRGGSRFPRGGANNARRPPQPPQIQQPLPPNNFMDAKRLIDSIDDTEYEQKDKADQNNLVGSIIYRLIVMKANEKLAPNITGMIIDMSLDQIKNFMANEKTFDSLIAEAIEILSKDENLN